MFQRARGSGNDVRWLHDSTINVVIFQSHRRPYKRMCRSKSSTAPISFMKISIRYAYMSDITLDGFQKHGRSGNTRNKCDFETDVTVTHRDARLNRRVENPIFFMRISIGTPSTFNQSRFLLHVAGGRGYEMSGLEGNWDPGTRDRNCPNNGRRPVDTAAPMLMVTKPFRKVIR